MRVRVGHLFFIDFTASKQAVSYPLLLDPASCVLPLELRLVCSKKKCETKTLKKKAQCLCALRIHGYAKRKGTWYAKRKGWYVKRKKTLLGHVLAHRWQTYG